MHTKQAQTRSGEWIFVDPIPGAFAINIGDMLARWCVQICVMRFLWSLLGLEFGDGSP